MNDFRAQLLRLSPGDLLLVVLAETESRANLNAAFGAARPEARASVTLGTPVICRNTLIATDQEPF